MNMNTCRALLNQWCDTLLKLQVHNTENPFLDGGILCPACGRIHGRCFDAIYPLMYMADVTGNETYLKGAQSLFDWAEAAVSRGNGSYVNDPGSSWAGTTVFSVIQLAESLEYHGHLLDESTREKWKKRIAKAADYLKDYQEFEVCNVNYRITNSLAMELCGKVLGEESYRKRGQELKEMAVACLTEQGLLVGEGRPVDGFSSKGCRPVDIGYNMEESLPSLVQYAYETDDEELEILVSKALKYHLRFYKDKKSFDFEAAKRKLDYCLKHNFWYLGREWPYKDVKPCIIAEKYMVDESEKELKDYKVFNFNGEPKIIQVDIGRFTHHKRNLYDKNWRYMSLSIQYPTDAKTEISKPEKLDEMLEIAKKLSKDIPFLRTDFYSIGNKIFFGEITFSHGSGFEEFRPNEWDRMLGDLIDIRGI